MTNLDRDLRDRLRNVDLPPAPFTLQRALRDIVRDTRPTRRSSRRPLILLGLAAVLAVAGAVAGAGLLNCDDAITYTDTFIATGSMTTPRLGHTATLLHDGRVLIAGGASDDTTRLSSAELYDPATGTFIATGSMTAARDYATATLLLDGRVLIVGGTVRQEGDIDRPTTAELYDPATGTFIATGSMTAARDYATATLLPDGRVLFAGGASGNPALPLSSAELYDPRTGMFTATGSMTIDRDGAVAVLLQDGRVLVAGGWVNAGDNSETETASAELYDPQSGTFTATGAMSARGAVPTAVLLPDGRVLVIGGRVLPTALNGQTTAEFYDPTSGTFTSAGQMVTPRTRPEAIELRDGRILIAGGGIVPETPELYDPASDTFTQAGTTTVLRTEESATLLLDGRVLLAGGRGGSVRVFLSSAELFH